MDRPKASPSLNQSEHTRTMREKHLLYFKIQCQLLDGAGKWRWRKDKKVRRIRGRVEKRRIKGLSHYIHILPHQHSIMWEETTAIEQMERTVYKGGTAHPSHTWGSVFQQGYRAGETRLLGLNYPILCMWNHTHHYQSNLVRYFNTEVITQIWIMCSSRYQFTFTLKIANKSAKKSSLLSDSHYFVLAENHNHHSCLNR